MLPDLPPMPALTRAEGELIDRYLAVVDELGRINPARCEDTYRALRAAQSLVSQAVALRGALESMYERGELDLYGPTLLRALRILDGERRTRLPAIPSADANPNRGGGG
jgi:hypothetical protein